MPSTIGAETESYGYTHAFHEIFVLFGLLAATTEQIGFMTGVVILPQRQTALVAKQAAALDVLSGGHASLAAASGAKYVRSRLVISSMMPATRTLPSTTVHRGFDRPDLMHAKALLEEPSRVCCW